MRHFQCQRCDYTQDVEDGPLFVDLRIPGEGQQHPLQARFAWCIACDAIVRFPYISDQRLDPEDLPADLPERAVRWREAIEELRGRYAGVARCSTCGADLNVTDFSEDAPVIHQGGCGGQFTYMISVASWC